MMTRTPSSSEKFNIAAISKKIDVDNRFALRSYCRIADNILKQADIFRKENNVIDLYIMLLRFSSLVSETIPCHKDYKASLASNKIYFKKKLLSALAELEELKPAVKQKLEELNRRPSYQVNNWGFHNQNNSQTQNSNSYGITKPSLQVSHPYVYNSPRTQQISVAKPVEDQFRRLALIIPPPKKETLSRHSILGPNGLQGQWQPPSYDKGVRYPSNLDLTPVEIPRLNSLQQPIKGESLIQKDNSSSEQEKQSSELAIDLNKENPKQSSELAIDLNKENPNRHFEELSTLISFETVDSPAQTDIIRQPSPPPVLAEVQDLIPATSLPVTGAESGMENISLEGLVGSEAPLELYISTALMDSFMNLAKSNTDKNLETCGILAGSLKNRKFYITALIIPKQESTSDSCNATNEEEIFEVQYKQSLCPLGWIHTHPTQSCFMSSVDVHTQYSYQIMLPESIAIVMAPRDSARKHGIFRLTTPGGMSVIKQCPHRGFHPHDPTSDGSPIYKQCTDVYMDNKLKFDIIDLR